MLILRNTTSTIARLNIPLCCRSVPRIFILGEEDPPGLSDVDYSSTVGDQQPSFSREISANGFQQGLFF